MCRVKAGPPVAIQWKRDLTLLKHCITVARVPSIFPPASQGVYTVTAGPPGDLGVYGTGHTYALHIPLPYCSS